MTVNDSGEIDGSLTAALAPLGTKSPSRGARGLQFFVHGGRLERMDTSTLVVTGISQRTTSAASRIRARTTASLMSVRSGSGGSDRLHANVYMIPGSTGTVGSSSQPSVLRTSGKKDQLRFTVYQGTDSTTTTNVYAEVIDTSKKDTSTHTANVTPQTGAPTRSCLDSGTTPTQTKVGSPFAAGYTPTGRAGGTVARGPVLLSWSLAELGSSWNRQNSNWQVACPREIQAPSRPVMINMLGVSSACC